MACVKLKDGALKINGKPTILLCSSLFYFRIPRAYWRQRMRDLKRAGYNAIDVYFPWNYHEVAPGQWDFTGERDAEAFLRLAAEEELYVVARPGPYICSEWDGGGIPAWVHLQTSQVRQYDAEYLTLFRGWMERILPIIQRCQVDEGGSVVLLQLENELDLFPCRHPRRYMEAIRDMADGFDIQVPYVACVAGKCDVDAATGSVEGITPAFNIYPPFSDPSVEEKMGAIQREILMPRGMPLLATETEREHNFMRRELCSGVRLISPYCQTASTNFDCRNGISSWSSTPQCRIVYITGDYDMGSMIKADGAVTHEFLEARLLANLFRTLGDRVAAGRPFAEHDIAVETAFRTNDDGLHAMALQGGGLMLCLPNLSRNAGTAKVRRGEEEFSLTVEGDTTRLLLFDLSLAEWGYPTTMLHWAAADVAWIRPGEIVLYGEGDGICLKTQDGLCRITRDETLTADGKPLAIRFLSREAAARAESPFLPAFEQPVLPPWHSEEAKPAGAWEALTACPQKTMPIQSMETMGAFDGRAVYAFDVPPCQALLLDNAADIASLWVDGQHQRTWVSDGSLQRVPVTGGHVTLRTEIWGHTCFDETYNPLLYMHSRRGLEHAYAILSERDIHANWRFRPDNEEIGPYVTPVWSALPCLTDYGTLIPKGVTLRGMYRKELVMPREGDVRLLSFEGATMQAAVYVNGSLVGRLDRTNPYMDITQATAPGKAAEVVIRVQADSCESLPGKLLLVAAKRIQEARVATESVSDKAHQAAEVGVPVSLPLTLKGGEAKWVRLQAPPLENGEQWLRPVGQDVMVTIVNHGHVLGRLMPNHSMDMLFRSGDPLRSWLPRAWLEEDDQVLLLIEGLREGARLDAIMLDRR